MSGDPMRMPRYDYRVLYPTPKSSPICHFYFKELRDVAELEEKWKKHHMDARVLQVTDTLTGQVLYKKE